MIGSRHLGSAPGRLALEIYLVFFLGGSSSGFCLASGGESGTDWIFVCRDSLLESLLLRGCFFLGGERRLPCLCRTHENLDRLDE